MSETKFYSELICCDCGCKTLGSGTPKEVAKRNNWVYANKGKWRCPECDSFIKKEMANETKVFGY